jgi:hypothetical protein
VWRAGRKGTPASSNSAQLRGKEWRAVEYKVLIEKAGSAWSTNFEDAAAALARKVNEAIRDGWEPQGGVAVGETTALDIPFLMQAMIKRD